MGGKTKNQTQRTKGNLRPASSSKSALQLDATNFDSFKVGFTSSLVPAFTDDLTDIDASVDISFQLVLRKMMKKDPTTKIKALREFTDQVNQSEVDIVKTVLPSFSKLYVQLATDVDARVRENSQNALMAVVNKIGKNLAAILKHIFPAWVCSQYDTHPTASSIASNSFAKAFPPQKVSDVFAFCETETLDYFIKNLTVLNQNTICNQKSYSPEECEEKYQRVVIASLRGYALYLEKISEEKLTASSEKNLTLISHDRFWSYHKHKTPQIRAAFFEALSSLIHHGSFLLANFEEQMTSTVFKAIDEPDSALLSHIWTCIILVQVKVENWSQYININKMLLPKMSKILRSAMFPSVIYPNLLPFISRFNEKIMPDGQLQAFHTKFFENINHGLINVHLGKSEISALVSGYFETLKFVIKQVAGEYKEGEVEKLNFCNSLLDDHVIAVIFWCMNGESQYGKQVYHHIAGLVNFWSKNSSVELYQQLLERFWSELAQILRNSLETSQNIANITSSQVELIKSLKNASMPLKSARVKFDDAPAKDVDVTDGKAAESPVKVTKLNEIVFGLCTLYIEKVTASHNQDFLENFEVLVKEYQSEELFKHLAKWRDEKEDNICSLYDLFSQWLLVDELRCEAIIEVILVLYKYLSPHEKIDLLNRWIRVPSVQNWIILRALSYPLCMEPDITKLLKMNEVTSHLVECARIVTNGTYKENLIILQKCFFQTEDGKILIDGETCTKIVDVISEPLHDEARKSQMDQCASFLAQIFPVICSDDEKKELQRKIFLSLFEFSITRELSDDVSQDTLWEVTTAWQDCLSSGDLSMDDFLLNACSKIVGDKIESFSMDKVTMKAMQDFAETVSKLVLCASESEEDTKSIVIEKMIHKVLKIDKELFSYLENLVKLVELMNGNVTLSELGDARPRTDFMDAFDTSLKHSVFNLEVIVKLTCKIKEKTKRATDDDEQEDEIEFADLQKLKLEEQEEEDWDVDENLLKEWTAGIFEYFFKSCYGEAIFDSILLNSRYILPEHETWIIFLQERMKQFMANAPEQVLLEIREKLMALAVEKNGLWPKSLLQVLASKDFSDDDGNIRLFDEAVIKSNSDPSMIGYSNIVHAFSKCLQKKALPISPKLIDSSLKVKVAVCRNLIGNHLIVGDYNDVADRVVVENSLVLLNDIMKQQKAEPFLMYNQDVSLNDAEKVLLVAEIAQFFADLLNNFPTEIDVRGWDFIRIALSSWVLSVAKSSEKFQQNKIKVFIIGIYKLNAALFKFFALEKTRSSTQMLQNLIEEWEKVFAREVNLVLIKSFIHIIKSTDGSKCQEYFIDALCPLISSIDFSYTLQSQKVDQTFSLQDLISFALENLSNKQHGTCVIAATILRQLTLGLIKLDKDVLAQRNSEDFNGKNDDVEIAENNRWHILDTFRMTLEQYQGVMKDFLEGFSFKVSENDDHSTVPYNVAFSYLLLWNCVLNFCSQAQQELRSIYARWITVHQYQDVFLVSLFELMSSDVIRNPDASLKSGHAAFSSLEWNEIEESNLDIGRYAAFMYTESLRTIPAVVRKWWHSLNSRDAQIVEKITQNYVSPILCQQDLTVLTTRKEKDGKDNMHIRVLIQAREIFATYTLEEAKMELSICLPPNYPLGAIKINSTKHIAGKLQAREIVKQLSIYLTHQNGRLYDGISLWKRNLDRKYEGVEECYVCYSVINQETCQLPRLTCKTCKKKFHSNCLYKWFTSSNKSTCPLCRNIF